jgi:hypothetical protein
MIFPMIYERPDGGHTLLSAETVLRGIGRGQETAWESRSLRRSLPGGQILLGIQRVFEAVLPDVEDHTDDVAGGDGHLLASRLELRAVEGCSVPAADAAAASTLSTNTASTTNPRSERVQ